MDHNKFNGQGKYTFKNGDNYEGQFTNDRFNGKGVLRHASGFALAGTFSND